MLVLIMGLMLMAGCSATASDYDTRAFFSLSRASSFTAARPNRFCSNELDKTPTSERQGGMRQWLQKQRSLL
jgi:hypothetical protein